MFIEERFGAIVASLSLSKEKTHFRVAAEGRVITADIPYVGNDPFVLNECSKRDGTTLIKSYPEELARKEWLRALLLLWSLQGVASLKLFGRFSVWKQLDVKSVFNLTYAEKANELFAVIEDHPEEVQPFVNELILCYNHLYETVLTKELIRRDKRYDDEYSFFDVVRLEGIYCSFNNKAAAVVELSSTMSENVSRSVSPVSVSGSRPARSASPPTRSRPNSVGKTRFVGIDDLANSQKIVRESNFVSNDQLSELKEKVSLLETSLKEGMVGKNFVDAEVSRNSNLEKKVLSLIDRQSELQKQIETLTSSSKKTSFEQKDQLDKRIASVSDLCSSLQSQLRTISVESKDLTNSLQSEISIVRNEGRSLQNVVKILETKLLELERSLHDISLKQQRFQDLIESRFASLETSISRLLSSQHQQLSYESRIANIESLISKTDSSKKLQVLEADMEKISKNILEMEIQQKKTLLVKR